MNVLVFGNSDSTGAFIEGKVWTQIARDLLQHRFAAPVTVHDIRFSAESPTAAAFASKKVRELEPDVIVLMVGSFPFTAGFTWVKVRSLFGERAGQRYRAFEDSFDQKTRHGGRMRKAVNKLARRGIRRVIGTKPLSTREELTASYLEIFATLSQFEERKVVLMSFPGRGAHALSSKARAQRKLFFSELRKAAEARHFLWVSGVDAFAAVPADVPVHTLDGLHYNDRGHQVLAAALVGALSA